MDEVSRDLVKIFFELKGFMVNSRTSLLIKNPNPSRNSAEAFVLNAETIINIHQALVEIKPWHTETFFPSVINSSPEVFRFLEQENLENAERFFEKKKFKKIIVLSKLPNVRKTLKKSIALLKLNGIDHAIEISAILNYLISCVKTNLNYTDSNLLQFIRIFKCYDLYKSSQLELFTKK